MTIDRSPRTYTAFADDRRIASGPIKEVALKAKTLVDASPETTILFFDDELGETVDVSLQGTATQLARRLDARFGKAIAAEQEDTPAPAAPGRGRPKLGVVAREVTLLPRHWEWLNSQPGSASVALRRLVDEARRTYAERDRRRTAQKATYLFISTMAGNRPYYEEAIRALFAGDRRRFFQFIEAWPIDILRYTERLSANAFADKARSSEAALDPKHEGSKP